MLVSSADRLNTEKNANNTKTNNYRRVFSVAPGHVHITQWRKTAVQRRKYETFYCAAVLIGGTTCLAHPSVRLSVCLSVLLFNSARALNSKKKRRRKPILKWTFPGAGITRVPIFSTKGQISGRPPRNSVLHGEPWEGTSKIRICLNSI